MAQPNTHDVHGESTAAAEGDVEHVRVHALVTLFLWAVGLVVLLWFWNAITMIAMIFLLSCAIAAGARPIVDRLPWSRMLSGLLIGVTVALLILGAIVLMVWLLFKPVQQELENWPEAHDSINQTLQNWSSKIGLHDAVTFESLATAAGQWFFGSADGSALAQAADSVTAVLIGFAMLLFGQIYLLVQPPGLITAPLARLLPPERRLAVHQTVDDIDYRLRWWLIGTLISMSIIAVATWVGYTLIGLKFAATLAIFGGLAQAVPTLGPAITLIVALLVASSQGTSQIIGVAAVYLGVQLIESYILLPLVMRQAVNIPPIVTLFSIVFWAKLLGPLGLLLALPIDLVIWSLVRHFVIKPRHDRIARLERLGDADDG